MTKSGRLIKMIDLLRGRPGATLAELADVLGRSERTIYRWLSEVENDLGVNVVCSDGAYYLHHSELARQVDLTPHELLALRLSLKSAPFPHGSEIREHADSAWLKIRNSASSDSFETSDGLARSRQIKVSAPHCDVPRSITSAIDNAIDTRRRLSVVYRSQKSDSVKAYTIDPYALVFRRHAWYLLAYSHDHCKVVQFKLVRFKDVGEAPGTFEVPPDFSPEAYFRYSWEAWGGEDPVRVRVRFSSRVAEMIAESRRHPTQQLHPTSDGGVVFEATVAGIEEIAIWIMGYGRDAEVLCPDSLRDYIAEHASGMLDHYVAPELSASSGVTAVIP